MENNNQENMDNENVSYEMVSFETEDGENVDFYILEQTMLGGINYILVTDDTESEEGTFLILKEVKDKKSEEEFVSYEIVEDDNELNAVVKVFDELLEDLDLEV